MDILNLTLLMDNVWKTTEQRKIEKSLKESEERYRQLFETALETIIVVQDYKLVYYNPIAYELTGYSDVELNSINFLDLIYFEDKERVQTNYEKRINGEKVQNKYSFRIITKDEKIKWVIVSGVNLEWNSKSSNLYFFTDITEQKEAEFELMRLNEDLTASKEEIEVNLYQKNALILELTEVKEKLELLNSTKDKFFSIISHDLKSPFQSFIGLTELISENIDDFTTEEVRIYMKEMNNKAQNLYKLLKNLLDWARMQRGITEYNPTYLEISKLIKETIEDLNYNALQKEIKIINNVKDVLLAYVDEQMLRSVLRNILSNSIKFTYKGGEVKIEMSLLDNKYFDIIITDNGIGMSEEKLKKLFKIEERVGSEGTEGEESTGLGLLLSKEFVEKNNGEIKVQSEEGKGSRFIISLPKLKND